MLNKVICRVQPHMTNMVQRRSLRYGLPQNRISLMEKGVLYTFTLAVITGPMFYIMGNLKKYQGKV